MLRSFHRRPVAATAAVWGLIAVPATAEIAYDAYAVAVDALDSPVLLHGKLTGRETDDLILFTANDDGRRMAVYALDGDQLQLAYAADVDADVIFVDLATLDGADRLLMYRRNHVDWLDPATWSRRPLVSAPSLYNVPPANVPTVELAQDVNADGRDDLALADFDGYWIWTQQPDGAGGGLTEPAKLRVEPTLMMSGFRSATYRARSLYRFDYDGDGLSDLAFWDRDRCVVYRARAGGGFATTAETFAMPVALTNDDLAVSFGIGGTNDEPTVTLYDIKDYNGDGVADIVTNSIEFDSLFSQSTRYDFHFGARVDGRTTFEEQPDTAISVDGVGTPFEVDDFDADGQIEFAVAPFELGLGKILAALITGTVRFDVQFYDLRNDAYPEEPTVTRSAKLKFSLRDGSATSGTTPVLGRVTGDGIADLLIVDFDDEVRVDVYPGTGAASMFAEQPITVRLGIASANIVATERADLNDDGKDDFVLLAAADGDDARMHVALSR